MTTRQRRWRPCTEKVVADLAIVPGCMTEGHVRSLSSVSTTERGSGDASSPLPGCQRRGGCGDVGDEKAHWGYRRNGSSGHHCRLRMAARSGVKMSGTQSRESDDVALPGVVRRLYVWAWEWVQKGKPLATTKRLSGGALGSESNLRVKA